MGPAHDKTGVFCKDEHRAGETEARGIRYTMKTICFIKKSVERRKGKGGRGRREDEGEDGRKRAYRLSVVQIPGDGPKE